MREPEFLSLAEALEVHRDAIERYGGARGVRDLGLLESALAVPQAAFDGEYLHADLFEMAAAYAYHIAENHPFVDGNKRAALASALVFLALNGVEVEDPRGRLYDAMMELAAGRSDKKAMAALLTRLAGGG